LASPLTYDSFIHYNLPVYPGALRQSATAYPSYREVVLTVSRYGSRIYEMKAEAS
jgi:hypothetical protein